MFRRLLTSAIFLLPTAVLAQKGPNRPKLVIGLVVDQMRWDYLYRYYEGYGKGGFRRLLDKGFACQQTFINYLPTFTAPGHACIYTGSVPAIHGIAANDWFDATTGRHWYCVEDTTVRGIGGGSRMQGMMSPRTMLTSTVTDELRLATNLRSRVFSLSLKDRSSVLPGGHLSNGTFWYDDSTGNFITSSFYAENIPAWLANFNSRHLADSFVRQGWTLSMPSAFYRNSLADSNIYEGLNRNENSSVFPHRYKAGEFGAIRRMPAGNTLTFELAKACLDAEKLGQHGETDFLAVSLASTDYTGHQYAPNSLEMEDVYYRLDRELADFLRYLDEKLGKGGYLIFLTADHGGAHNAAYLQDLRLPAGAILESAYRKNLKAFAAAEFGGVGPDDYIRGLENYQVYLNEKLIAEKKADRPNIKEKIRQWLLTQKGVMAVIDLEDADRTLVPEPIRTMAINGYHRTRSGVLQIILEPAWYSGYGTAVTGTTHGGWNPYDSHIPLLWYGWHIPKGESFTETHMTDIAATLAALLHIQMPNGCIGKPIRGVLGQ